MGAYEFVINNLCEKHTPRELAELYLSEKETNNVFRCENSDLRSEIETLKYLIAKYNVEKENG